MAWPRSMKTLLLLLAAAALAVAVGAAASRTPDPPFLLGGIQVNEADHHRWFEALIAAGMNTVSVTTYAKQGDWDSDNVWWDAEDSGLLAEIRGARAHGLEVVLILRVALDHAFERNRFLWHGMIMPRSDALIDAWFRRYRRFVLRWAEVAEREGVGVLAVASEMSALTSTVPLEEPSPLVSYYLDDESQRERRERLMAFEDEVPREHLWVRGWPNLPSLEVYLDEETAANRDWARQVAFAGETDALERMNRRRERLDRHWRELVRDVRAVYGGRLGYAANFDQYRDVGFWDALDVIGVNAYFPLRPAGSDDTPEAMLPVLEASWDDILDELDAFRRERDAGSAPVLFTEIGYTFRKDSTVQPWAGFGFSLVEDRDLVVWEDQPHAPGERALALRALAASAARRDGLLAGLLYWKLSTEPAHREVEPFVHILGDPSDPLTREWPRFSAPP